MSKSTSSKANLQSSEWFISTPMSGEPFDVPDKDGRMLRIVLSALKQNETLLTEIERVGGTGAFCWHAETDAMVCTSNVYRLFDLDPTATVTLSILATRVHPDDLALFDDMVKQAREEKTGFECQFRLRLPHQGITYLQFSARRCHYPNRPVQYVGAIQDITRRRLSEEAVRNMRSELTRMARVSSLGALTASIAHEVNQPLSGILTNASTCLQMLSADPPEIAGALETARRTIRDGERACEVITRLRALFGNRDGTTEHVDLNAAAREVIALSSSELHRRRLTLHTQFNERLPAVMGDRVQLQQVILNLVLNAAEAMSGVEDRQRLILIRTETEGSDIVRVSVRDAGTGFDRHDAERLFEAFYTTKSGGMGIGLSVSRSIVESHGGRLWAESNPGPGATFGFSIPARVFVTGDSKSASGSADVESPLRGGVSDG